MVVGADVAAVDLRGGLAQHECHAVRQIQGELVGVLIVAHYFVVRALRIWLSFPLVDHRFAQCGDDVIEYDHIFVALQLELPAVRRHLSVRLLDQLETARAETAKLVIRCQAELGVERIQEVDRVGRVNLELVSCSVRENPHVIFTITFQGLWE